MKITPKYFEDFEVGYSFETKPTLISKEEIINFASKYDPQLFHLDEEKAKDGPFGQLTSSGFMTLGKSFTQIFMTGIFDCSTSNDSINFCSKSSEIALRISLSMGGDS